MGVEGREEESGEIVVGRIGFIARLLNLGWVNRDVDDDSGIDYVRVEFPILDLSGGGDDGGGTVEIRRDVLPPLFARTSGGALISWGPSSFSVFGGLSPTIDESLAASLNPPPERHPLYYKGAATISLDGDDKDGGKWEAFPLQFDKFNAHVTVCAVLSGKLYNFGYITLYPEVFDPSLGCWAALRFPGHLSNSRPSFPVVADPRNRRILIHFRSPLAHLYAFYPSGGGGRWEHLKPDSLPWSDVVALDGDLLFLYYNFYDLRVYDLASPSGERLNVVWSSSMCGQIHVACLAFTWLFSLGNGFMCLADSVRQRTPDNTTLIFFFIFRAHRSTTDSTSIYLTPVSFHYKFIESTSEVLDLLPLSQEASEILGKKLACNNVVE